MDESESKNENPEKERRFDPELLKKGLRCDRWQYKFLKECSDKGKVGIKKWNKWRKGNKTEDICLEGADLHGFYLEGVWLQEKRSSDLFGKVCLKCAILDHAHMKDAELLRADLKNASFYHTVLENATLSFANLEGADFRYTNLKHAKLQFCTVNGATIFLICDIDKHTWFYGVGLSMVRIDPRVKELLEYNVRRSKWMVWYKWSDWYEGCPKIERSRSLKALCWTVRAFWEISDYGISTKRIIVTFFGLAIIFANIYYHWGRIAPPGIVDNLFIDRNGIEVQWWLVPLRTLYFSIVTMTTLGFGDMYANAQSILGHLLLMLQVILGYVLLGALVTRFAVLFTAGGLAGKFSKEKKN